MAYTQELTLDLARIGTPRVPAKQADHGYDVKISVLENTVNIVDHTTDTATFRLEKPDGNAVTGNCTVNNDDTVTLTIDDDGQMLAVAGKTLVDISIVDGDGNVKSTQNFIFDVQAAPAGTAVESSSVFSNLQHMYNSLVGLYGQAPGIVESVAKSAVASFSDGAEGYALRDLNVDIDPVQDLNGYSNPWPAGGGKNVAFDVVYKNQTVRYASAINASYVVKGGKRYVFSFMTSNTGESVYRQTPNALGFDSLSGYDFVCDGTRKYLYGTATTDATLSNKGIILKAANNGQAVGLCSDFMIEEVDDNTTTPSDYEPYSNICPITGWTAANVYKTGINLWDEEWELGNINGSGENLSASDRIRSKNYIPVVPNATYYYYINSTYGLFTWGYDAEKNYVGRVPSNGWATSNSTVTIPSNVHYIRFVVQAAYGTTYNNDISINYPSTDTSYHAYNSDSEDIAIDWTSEAGTVYGGSLDVTTGVLTVDRKSVILDGSQTITATTSNRAFVNIQDAKTINASNQLTEASVMCESGISTTWGGLASGSIVNGLYCSPVWGNGVGFRWDVFTTAQEWITYFTNNPTQFSYKLDTPITYQLTPTEVTAFLQTNIWADTGDVSVDYVADTKTYIDNAIATAIASI